MLPNLAGGPLETTLLGTGGSAVPTTVNNGSLVVVAPSDADFNSDGDVDGDDFLKWQRGFGTGTTFAEGDADFDGDVDGSDLSIWSFLYSGNIAPVAAVSAAIPEPTSCSLALACFVIISGLSHRRTS